MRDKTPKWVRNLCLSASVAAIGLSASAWAGAGRSTFVLAPDINDKLMPDLVEAITTAPQGQLIPISIVMADQAPRGQIQAWASIRDKQLRREAVSGILKEVAARSQGNLLAYLEQQQMAGNVGDYIRPLWIHNVIGANVTADVAFDIASRDDVAYVNYDQPIGPEVFPVEPAQDPQGPIGAIECGVDLMDADRVWNELGITGAGVVVDVIDTGVCITHPDLANQIWVNPGETPGNGIDDDGNGFIDDINGWNFESNNNNVGDSAGHGTHVSGTVAGDGTNGEQTGMAPDANIMMSKFWNSFSGEQTVWDGMQYGVDNGAHVITASLGWPRSMSPDLYTWRTICENSIAAGVVVIYAAGNEGCGNPPYNVRTPGDVPDVLTVGAVDCNDNQASFTSCGPITWQDVDPWYDWAYPPGKIKPTIAAPGVNTLSTSYNCSGYTNMSGTSMATPHVAGAVALMLEANPDLDHFGVKDILEATAVDLGDPGKDNVFGSGRVNAYEAVLEALASATIQFNFPNGLADVLDPDGGTSIRVEVLAGAVDPQPGTGMLYYRIAPDGSWVSTAMSEVTPNVYDAVFPAFDCLSSVDYYFSAETVDGDVVYDPRKAPDDFYSASVAQGSELVFAEDFEDGSGWGVSYSNMSAGRWVRGIPVANGGTGAPEADFDGSGQCYVTGNTRSEDVDGGPGRLTSPTFSLGNSDGIVSYAYWMYTSRGTPDTLDVEVSNDGGSNWARVTQHGNIGKWAEAAFRVSDFIPPSDSMKVRFLISDNPDDSTTEAAIDAFGVTEVYCDRLTLTADPLVHGQTSTLTAANCTGGTTVYFVYSRQGYGTRYISGLDVTLNLDSPKLAGSADADRSGFASIDVKVPNGATGINVWLQAAEYQRKSTIVVDTVQ
ncbi:MAG: hypothetical protein D8M59_10865 [Planctomycetes bacterium]|nr:hypothetical protein [Planctomycetota bacterium]NOG54149.1 S8 family serine peptidase [Planctomycetota bacterium]